MSYPCLLISLVPNDKSTANFILEPLEVIRHFPFAAFKIHCFFCPFCSLPLLFLSCVCCYIWMFGCVPQVTEAFCSFSLFLLSVLRLYHLIRSIFKIGWFSYMFRSAIETSREFTIIVLQYFKFSNSIISACSFISYILFLSIYILYLHCMCIHLF